MTTPVSAASNLAIGTISIRVTGPDGFCAEHDLPPGDAIVVGTSPACGVRIEGPGIAPMHCTLSCEEGQLVVDDWDTGAGTYLDGERIARQGTAAPGATVQIGDYRFVTAPAGEVPAGHSLESLDAQSFDDRADAAADDTDPFLRTDPAGSTDAAQQSHNWDKAGETAAAEPFEEDAFDLGDADDFDTLARPNHDTPADAGSAGYGSNDYDTAGYDAPADETPAYETPSYDSKGVVGADDVTDLLKIELEYLRTELAERDARVAELERSLEGGVASHDDDLPSRQEVDALAGRLEQLLEELDHSDERLKTMAELLRVSEEANVAAVEERAQMESWMGEVERRVSDWESEWHAERDSLQSRIAELTAQRDEAEARGASQENTDLLQKLRQQITQLEAETARLQAERSDLEQRMQVADVSSIEERIQQSVDEAMREERLQLSQERAEVARERAELMKQRDELAAQPSSHTSSADVADLKIRAFREHLREIRENEPNHRPAPTMSQRLGKLWRKIDGRPLDTD